MIRAAPSACEYRIEGNPAGPTLVFIHGWPDNASLWRKQVAALGAEFRCMLLTLPNFGERSVKAGGFDFPELVDRVAATLDEVQPQGRVGLVTHDWGAYLGYLVEQAHPERVERLAALDIGGHLQPSGLKEALMILGYQWALVVCWWVGGIVPPLGTLLSKGVAKVIRVPSRQRAHLRSRYNYPYFYLWRNTLLPWLNHRLLRRYRPQCPVLFLWGERKPMMFHSRKWLQIVADSGGRAEGIPGAGHWLMETHAELINERLRDWFAPLQRSAGGTTDAPMERSAGGTTDAPMERNPRD
jgi:pimeloyl-ACP methyl ester carboxylesterase